MKKENVGSSSAEDDGHSSKLTKENIQSKYVGVAPFVGMVFETLDEAHSYYELYAKLTGFSMKIRTTYYFSRSKEISARRYTCTREESCSEQDSCADVARKKNTLTSKCGYLVVFIVRRKTLTEKWEVRIVQNSHNHPIASLRSIGNLRNQKVMPSIAKNLVEKFSQSGLPTCTVSDVLDDQMGVNFSSRDCWNHMRDVRKLNLDFGDAESVFNYCRMKQTHDPNFYYSIKLDDDGRMVRFFWVDSRARLCYERFGDVVTFDTTYNTNKYKLPCGLFVGVNNHFQSILFGCALLQDESEDSYEWLFKTWLDAMKGKPPISILTDQDKAIGNMVKKVFPTSIHRLCLWHIMKKFPEKYSHLYRAKSPFKKDIKGCLHKSITIEGFDEQWKEIMTKYNLQDDEWLQGLFKIRSSWVPVYNRTVFFAGMNTTQRSESMNSFFNEFVNNATTLREFVTKYEKVVLKRYKDENKEHYNSKHKQPTDLTLEISDHAASVYTRNIFNMFENEVKQSLRLDHRKVDKNESLHRYLISGDKKYNKEFVVSFDTVSRDVSCQCHLFEFKGILCRHILAILKKKGVHEIPPRYILSRWTKEAADGIPIPMTVEMDSSSLIRILEFRNKASALMPYLHESDDSYQEIMDGMDKIIEKVQHLRVLNNNEVVQTEEGPIKDGPTLIADPLVARTKGRPKNPKQESKNGRFKGGLETAIIEGKKQKRKCGLCHEEGHYSNTCKKQKGSDAFMKE